jgi:nitrate/nitrite transporter NarK
MDFYENLFITTLITVVGFIAWRVWTIESNHLRHLNEDVKELKTDIKWLIEFHKKEK